MVYIVVCSSMGLVECVMRWESEVVRSVVVSLMRINGLCNVVGVRNSSHVCICFVVFMR